MIIRSILLVGLSLLLLSNTHGQQFREVGDPTRPIKLNNLDDKDFLEDVPFIFTPYEGPLVRMNQLKASLPQIARMLPDSLEIIPPEKGWLGDLTYGMTYLYDPKTEGGVLLLMLVGDALSPYPKFFVDQNLNNDFSDDGPPYLFRNKQKKYKNFFLRSRGTTQVKIDFVLMNPAMHQSVMIIPSYISTPVTAGIADGEVAGRSQEDKPTVGSAGIKTGKRHRLGLQAGLSFGMGKIRYSWPGTKYRVYYNPRAVSGGGYYQYKHYYLGFWASLESIYYQASFLESGSGFFSNPDFLPANRYTWSGVFGYVIDLAETVHLTPFVHYTTIGFSDPGYVPRRDFPDARFDVPKRHNFGPGVQMAFDLNGASSVLIRGSWMGVDFTPTGFFEEETNEMPVSSDKQFIMSVGYQHSF